MSTKVSLTASARNMENYVALKWDNSDLSGRYSYKIYSKKSNESEFQNISAKSNVSTNSLFYLVKITQDTSWDDHRGQDLAAPEKPVVEGAVYNEESESITVRYSCHDRGTTYDYYIEAINLDTKEKTKSEIKSVTVATEVKGYLISLDDKPDTIMSGDIVTDSTVYTIPLDSPKFNDIYIHIAAVDNAGNTSESCHYKKTQEREKLILRAETDNKNNHISLTWKNSDDSGRYSYMVYSKSDDEKEFQSISVKSHSRVLNVYPECGDNLKGWMENPNYESEQGYGKGFISVDAVSINDFNQRPGKYLKDNEGNWKYDVLYVGAWDSNNNKDYSKEAVNVIEEFIKAGRGFMAGHDFFTESTMTGIPLSKYENIVPGCIKRGYGSDYIRINKKGVLINYPWKIGEIGSIINIPFSHTSQFSYGDIWMKYPENKWSDVEELNEYKGRECTNNFYLSTWNNTAMIQTGHSNGYATNDEQKLLANTILYLTQVTEETSCCDYKGQDVESPDKPKINEVYYNRDNNSISISYIPSHKKGTTYSYYVVATNLDTNEKIKSKIKKVTINTELKGYIIVADNNPYTIPSGEVITKSREYAVSLKNVNPEDIYVHVVAIDNSGNISEVCHYECKN